MRLHERTHASNSLPEQWFIAPQSVWCPALLPDIAFASNLIIHVTQSILHLTLSDRRIFIRKASTEFV